MDFRFDHVLLDPHKREVMPVYNDSWVEANCRTQADVLYSIPRVQRLLCQVRHLTARVWDETLARQWLADLCPPSLSTPSPFARLQCLELIFPISAELILERLFPCTAAFPCLEVLRVWTGGDVEGRGKREVIGRLAFLPLGRLPLLHSLRLRERFTVDGFFFLCSLPLKTLELAESAIDTTTAAEQSTDTVTSTWQEVDFPLGHPFPENLPWACIDVLDGHASAAVAATAAYGGRQLKGIAKLTGGWDIGEDSLVELARIRSLMELRTSFEDLRRVNQPGLSPLFTDQLRPVLPLLHTFHFSRIRLENMSNAETEELVESSRLFLIAYSAQLQELNLVVYVHQKATQLLETLLQCSQLKVLIIENGDPLTPDRCAQRYGPTLSPGIKADVEQLDPAVQLLPHLAQLTCLRLRGLYFTVQGITQFLNKCTVLRRCVMRRVYRHLPDEVQCDRGRRVYLDHRD